MPRQVEGESRPVRARNSPLAEGVTFARDRLKAADKGFLRRVRARAYLAASDVGHGSMRPKKTTPKTLSGRPFFYFLYALPFRKWRSTP